MFPTPGSDFPPREWESWFGRLREWQAWYSGDPEMLANFYAGLFPNTPEGRFWANVEKAERRTMVHMPVAGDIAAMSANLLFSEAPEIMYDPEKKGSGERLDAFMRENGLHSRLLEGAEMCAGLSAMYLKLDSMPELVEVPILSIVPPLNVFPEFSRGRLVAVTFGRTVREEEHGIVWRLFEDRRRESGKLHIEYRLYRGTANNVGRVVGLEDIEETKRLGLEGTSLDMDGLGVVYVPNMLPNKLIPGSPWGISDYSNLVGLMDSLDEAWSSWMRDLRLGVASLFVDEELLEDDGRYPMWQEIFIKLNLEPLRLGNEKYEPIKANQFEIRVKQHQMTCEALTKEIISRAGYSPNSFGMDIQGRAESGTSLRIRERKSILTRDKKSRYWTAALADLFAQVQAFDGASGLASNYEPQEVNVILQDSIVPDEKEVSETLRNLDQAKAVSTYVKVKRLHPDWTEEEVEKEVERINMEQGGDFEPFQGIV